MQPLGAAMQDIDMVIDTMEETMEDIETLDESMEDVMETRHRKRHSRKRHHRGRAGKAGNKRKQRGGKSGRRHKIVTPSPTDMPTYYPTSHGEVFNVFVFTIRCQCLFSSTSNLSLF